MCASIDQPLVARNSRVATARQAAPANLKLQPRPTPTLAAIWQDGLLIFVSRAPLILLIACVCIAGSTVLCLLAIGTDLRLD